MKRVKQIKEDPDVSPIAIFPEGGTSNGKYLLHFKRGAFEPEEPIQPYFIEYTSPFCNPACDVFPMHLHYMFMACQPFSTITLRKMGPVFPTEFMYRKFKDYGAAKPEIYAAAVREIYSVAYGIKKVNNSLMEKVRMNEYLYDFKKEKYE